MILFLLFKEFFKIGLFSVGGGYATLPFLLYLSERYSWYSVEELNQIIALGSITPGPVGINMATYAGLKISGILGATVATLSIVLPAYIIVVVLAKFLKKYSHNAYVKSVIAHLKPAGCALLFSVLIKLIVSTINNLMETIILVILLLILITKQKSPLFFIALSGVIGLFLNFVSKI